MSSDEALMSINQALDQENDLVRGIDALAPVFGVDAAIHVTSDEIALPAANL